MASRRSRERAMAVKVKSFADWDWSGAAYSGSTAVLQSAAIVRIGNVAEPALTEMEQQILEVLAAEVWTGDPLAGGLTSGNIAAKLNLKPRTAERQALNESLTSLRKAGRLKFEFNSGYDREIRWWRMAAAE